MIRNLHAVYAAALALFDLKPYVEKTERRGRYRPRRVFTVKATPLVCGAPQRCHPSQWTPPVRFSWIFDGDGEPCLCLSTFRTAVRHRHHQPARPRRRVRVEKPYGSIGRANRPVLDSAGLKALNVACRARGPRVPPDPTRRAVRVAGGGRGRDLARPRAPGRVRPRPAEAPAMKLLLRSFVVLAPCSAGLVAVAHLAPPAPPPRPEPRHWWDLRVAFAGKG